MIKRYFWILFFVTVFGSCFTINQIALAGPISLKAICFLPKTNPMARTTLLWVDRVNKEFKGEIHINYLGGPEVIASKEQFQALQNGIVDINFNVTSYYAPYAPEMNAFGVSKLTPMEEREPGGFYDYMAERHKKIGALYLGRWLHGSFYVWVNRDIAKSADLSGLKIRVGPMYIYFMKKLGVSSVSIKITDIYTAIERGLVDGFALPLLGARELGFTKKCKYLIDHPFYEMDGTILFNIDTWNKIPENIRERLIKFTIQYEKDMVALFQKAYARERAALQKAQVKFVKFQKEDGLEYVKKADEAYWEFLKEKVPDLIPDLKRVTGN